MMRRGRKRINLFFFGGSKGEEGTKDIIILLSLSGAINRSRRLRTGADWEWKA